MGCALGLAGAYLLDRKWLRFSTEAPLPGQLLKVVLGLGLTMALRAVLKAPLNHLLGSWADLVRYFLTVLAVGGLWPASFPFFARLGRKKQ